MLPPTTLALCHGRIDEEKKLLGLFLLMHCVCVLPVLRPVMGLQAYLETLYSNGPAGLADEYTKADLM